MNMLGSEWDELGDMTPSDDITYIISRSLWHLFSGTLTSTPNRPIVSQYVNVFLSGEDSPELQTRIRTEKK